LYHPNEAKVLALIRPDDLVLDLGGWARPFNRADYVMDLNPYETRRRAEDLGLKPSGGSIEHFTSATWIRRDICDPTPWPFESQSIDFCLCSRTLEELRDPIRACREMIRVAKRGYIEVTSRLSESCRGQEPGVPVGFARHRWLIDIEVPTIVFTPKSGLIHGDGRLSFPASFGVRLPAERRVSWLFWEAKFLYQENVEVGRDELAAFRKRHCPDEGIEGTLEDALEQVAALRGQLARFEEVGPLGIGIARRLHRTSQRHPKISSAVKRIISSISTPRRSPRRHEASRPLRPVPLGRTHRPPAPS
jgi:SAM-dependent methyltransferase